MEGPPLKRRKTRSDLPGPSPRAAPKSSHVAHRQPKSPRDDGGRSVRPRPLHINDKVQIHAVAQIGRLQLITILAASCLHEDSEEIAGELLRDEALS